MSNMSSDNEGPTLTLFTCCDHAVSKWLTLHTCIINGPYRGIPAYNDLLQDGRAPIMLVASELDHLLADHVVTLEALCKAMLQTCAQESTIGCLQSDLSHKANIADALHARLTKANQKAFAAVQDLSKTQELYKQLSEDDHLTKATEELASATACIVELERDLLQAHLHPLDLLSVAMQTSTLAVSSVSIQASAPTSYTSSGAQTNSRKLSSLTPLPPTTALTSYAKAIQ